MSQRTTVSEFAEQFAAFRQQWVPHAPGVTQQEGYDQLVPIDDAQEAVEALRQSLMSCGAVAVGGILRRPFLHVFRDNSRAEDGRLYVNQLNVDAHFQARFIGVVREGIEEVTVIGAPAGRQRRLTIPVSALETVSRQSDREHYPTVDRPYWRSPIGSYHQKFPTTRMHVPLEGIVSIEELPTK